MSTQPSITWLVPKRGGSQSGPAIDYAFAVSNFKSGKTANNNGTQGAIRVSAKAMQALRWIAGDRVQIGCDKTHVYMKRVPSGGYALSAVGGAAESGKARACCIKTSRILFEESKSIDSANYAVLDDGTVMFEAKAILTGGN